MAYLDDVLGAHGGAGDAETRQQDGRVALRRRVEAADGRLLLVLIVLAVVAAEAQRELRDTQERVVALREAADCSLHERHLSLSFSLSSSRRKCECEILERRHTGQWKRLFALY